MSKKAAKAEKDERLVTSRELPARSSTLTKVLTWLRTEVISYEATSIVLAEAGGDPVLVLEPDGEDSWCEPAAQQIVSAAEADATSVNGKPVKYHAQAFIGKAIHSRCSFLVRSGDVVETADGAGLLSQAYRHLESRDKVTSSSMQALLGNYDRLLHRMEQTNDRLLEERERAQERQVETIRLIEQLMSRQHDRDLAAMESEQALEMKARVVQSIGLVANAAAHKLSGQQLQLGDGKGNGIKALTDSLTPEQLEVIGKTLSPEQLILLSTLAGGTPSGG